MSELISPPRRASSTAEQGGSSRARKRLRDARQLVAANGVRWTAYFGVQYALRAAARPDREAFVLHAIEGFSLDEIAAITDRTPAQVEQSIRAAREKLRHSFPINNPFKEKVLPQTGTA